MAAVIDFLFLNSLNRSQTGQLVWISLSTTPSLPPSLPHLYCTMSSQSFLRLCIWSIPINVKHIMIQTSMHPQGQIFLSFFLSVFLSFFHSFILSSRLHTINKLIAPLKMSLAFCWFALYHKCPMFQLRRSKSKSLVSRRPCFACKTRQSGIPSFTHSCDVLLYFCQWYTWSLSKTQRLKKLNPVWSKEAALTSAA